MTQVEKQHVAASNEGQIREAQTNFSTNEQRMITIGIGKSTRNMLIALGKIEDAVKIVTDEIIATFGVESAGSLIDDVKSYQTDMESQIFYLISEVMQKRHNSLVSTEL